MGECKIKEFEEWLIESEKSENTIDNYLYAVKQFFSEYDEVTKRNMIDFKKKKLENFSPKTAANRCIGMNQYCKFIGKEDCVVKSVKIHKQNSVENVPTLEEYGYLLKCLEKDKKWKIYWILQFLSKTGARASEFIRFERKHLEDGEATLWTKGKMRKILIPQDLIEESKPYFEKQAESKYLFPNRYGEMMTTRGIASIITSLEKYGVRKEILHPHAFRHLYAIQFLKNNSNIALLADLMGHESVGTTAIYLRLSAKEQKEQFNNAMNW